MLAWIGTVCGIIGSLLVAANTGLQFVGYVFFMIGAIACLLQAWSKTDWPNIVLWSFFSCVNLWGIINYA